MDFSNLQEFMAHTKGVIYVLIIAILLGFTAFWGFLSGNDDD
jgi:hypothetical protein